MASLLLGPVLRHIGERSATIWVETDAPCEVSILGATARTFTVRGHHYALVVVTGLEPGTSTEYGVHLDDAPVWPPPGAAHPSRIRTLSGEGTLKLVFGSCRHSTPTALGEPSNYDPDALEAFSRRLRDTDEEAWPDLLLLLGDQVYADETSPRTQERIAERRDTSAEPGTQVADFEEYTWLYAESWGEDETRWLLSTVPSGMIFDDHDVHDDWNTSASWRADVQATSWWGDRIVGGLASYWVYQHLGNLSPERLADDIVWRRVRAAADRGEDAWPILAELARAADGEADGGPGYLWSYRLDLGPARLLVLDSRCGRVLDEGSRSMVSEPEWQWVSDQLDGSPDHLLVGSSLPWLLPRALHEVEGWNEALAAGSRGPRIAKWSEWLRRKADLEHWGAMRESFDRLAALLGEVGRGERSDRAPATINVLSGDVHHVYAARADLGPDVMSRVHQITCSPVHNTVPLGIRLGFSASWTRPAEAFAGLLGRWAKVPATPVSWRKTAGPYYGNSLATLQLDGRAARLVLEQVRTDHAGRPYLETVRQLPLSWRSADEEAVRL
jgi:hypothetical protein